MQKNVSLFFLFVSYFVKIKNHTDKVDVPLLPVISLIPCSSLGSFPHLSNLHIYFLKNLITLKNMQYMHIVQNSKATKVKSLHLCSQLPIFPSQRQPSTLAFVCPSRRCQHMYKCRCTLCLFLPTNGSSMLFELFSTRLHPLNKIYWRQFHFNANTAVQL